MHSANLFYTRASALWFWPGIRHLTVDVIPAAKAIPDCSEHLINGRYRNGAGYPYYSALVEFF
jgi:hypothetical protein